MKLKVGIIGTGLIGKKRAQALKDYKKDELVGVADIDYKKAKNLAEIFNCQVFSVKDLIKDKRINVLVLATPNKFNTFLAIEALKQKKHILYEKPFGRNTRESKEIIEFAKRYKCLVKVGFNHRFHPGILKAKKIVDKGEIGNLIFIRARYGHGGRLKMEKEWRLKKEISGGGELLDQGVHIVDLVRFFVGEIEEVFGFVGTKFWKTKVEDNAFVLMRNKKVDIQFHVSWTNWKNIFSFEIFGDRGYLEINGLGGSYGKERLVFGKRRKEFGKPIIKEYEFEKDDSWQKEWENFSRAIKGKEKFSGDMFDGLKANQIIEGIYKSAEKAKIIKL